MAQHIATALRLVESENQTVSCQHFEKSRMLDLMSRSLTLAEANEIREIALSAPVERASPASPEQISKHLQFIAATLPSRNVDEETGRQRFAVYVRILGGYSDDAMKFMSVDILRNNDWFPTPNQCLTVLEQYCPPVDEIQRALMIAGRSVQDHFEEWLARLQESPVDQSVINEAPDRWKQIARERGTLRFNPDDGFTQRHLPKIEHGGESCAA